MKTNYLAVWKFYGADALAIDTTNLELARLNDPEIVAILTADPEPFFQHIDQSAVIASQLVKGLTGVFAPDQRGTFEERFAAKLENVRAGRAKQTAKGLFLVIKGETNVAAPNFTTRRDAATLAVCFDAVDKAEIRELFDPSIHAVLTALTLSIPPNADHQVERVGEVIYLLEPDGEKPIYSFSVQMAAPRLSIVSPLSDAAVSHATKWIPKLIDDKTLARPASLVVMSLDRTTDALQGFLAAWSALEIFVNATFKSTYESRWFDVMQNGASGAVKPVFNRVKDVMSDKYRLGDKFSIMAALLNMNAAETDADEFRKLKSIRDDLLHGLDTPAHLLTEAVQNLLFRYVSLHLDRSKTQRRRARRR
jgi:hypothetical protein